MKLTVYSMENCQPCKQLKQVLNDAFLDDIELEELDVHAVGREALMKVNVKGAPALILYDNQGNEIKRKTGTLTKEQLRLFLGLDWIAVSAKQLDNI